MVRLKLNGRSRRGHQKRSRNALAGYIGNDDLNAVRVDGDIVVIIAAHAPLWLHHAGNFESGDGWLADRKKQALDLCSQLHVVKKVVSLLPNRSRQRFALLDIPLDEVNDKGEAQHRRDIVEDPKPRVKIPGGVVVMEQHAHGNKAVADFPAQENRPHAQREYVEVNKRSRNHEMVCVGYRDKRS